ncbi:unnamed protein product [Cylicocyclus nassatus]|uniref:Uncharacterized protein n=1 Tax=Cylicocyclus nassatus TaxID=53992 RepID=A0AA36GWF8_CYLNA|nr:unnamed protein product [Cylicocyclus nassatus]
MADVLSIPISGAIPMVTVNKVFKCLYDCDEQEENDPDRITCMRKCPLREIRECKKLCNAAFAYNERLRRKCLDGVPMTCLLL